MDAAFEIQRTSLKIYPVCISLLSLWGLHSITSLQSGGGGGRSLYFFSTLNHEMYEDQLIKWLRCRDNERRKAPREAEALKLTDVLLQLSLETLSLIFFFSNLSEINKYMKIRKEKMAALQISNTMETVNNCII